MPDTISHGADDKPTITDSPDTHEQYVEYQLSAIRKDLDFIKEHIVKSAEVIEKVGAEVMPTIAALSENPMVKMLLKKGAK